MLSDLRFPRGDQRERQCFRVRAGAFASAHGRPNDVPGRIAGARAKTLRRKESAGNGRGALER
jgi:hypothetical protein